jgi:hypothetical protein
MPVEIGSILTSSNELGRGLELTPAIWARHRIAGAFSIGG